MNGADLFIFNLEQFNWFSSTEFLSVKTLLFAISCYIYSAVPFAIIITRLFKKGILSKMGSTNIGVANAFGIGGLKVGFATVAAEISKAMLPLSLAHFFYGSELNSALVLTLATIFGAHFSIFLKGKGGRATTILLWILLILSPFSFLTFGAVFLVLLFATRRQYQTAMLGYALLPFEIYFIEGNIPFALFGLVAALIYLIRYDRSKSDVVFYSKRGRFMLPSLKRKYLIELSRVKEPYLVGSKAHKLAMLKRYGFKVPNTWVCTSSAFEDYVDGKFPVIDNLKKELTYIIKDDKKYSVRSSANIEDGQYFSYAGQFESYLDIAEISSIVQHTIRIWESYRGFRLTTYLNKVGESKKDIKMAIIIQETIDSEISGVVFTRNPVNSMDEVIVELVRGSGESLVQAGVTPDRYVYKWGNWLEIPINQESVPPLISEIISQAKTIAKRYGKPVDLEWTYDGNDLYWLQLREVTTLRGTNIYSNKISKEFLPGIIKPLVWSVNTNIVNTAWKRLLVELFGKVAKVIDINDLTKQFYYRAYFNMGIIGDIFELVGIPRESIELIMGMEVPRIDAPKMRPGIKVIRFVPLILLFAIRKLIYIRELERFCKTQKSKIDQLEGEDSQAMGEKATLRHIEQSLQIGFEASYHVIVTQLFMGLYSTVLRRLLAKEGMDIADLNFAREKTLLRAIDMDYHLGKLNEKYQNLPDSTRSSIRDASLNNWLNLPGLKDLQLSIDEFLMTFGHLAESSNDFSKPTYRENIEMLLNIITNYPKKERGKNNSNDLNNLPKGFLKGPFIRWVYSQTMNYRVYRYRLNHFYSRVYSMFRIYFLRLGSLFVAKGFIKEETDIFYLTYDEIKEITQSSIIPVSFKANLMQRKREIAEYQDITLPNLIVGDEVPIPHGAAQIAKKLSGIAAAKGYYEGNSKVIRGLGDFGKVKAGDILVIPYSDVSWTPLFAKAKAIVSESGGILSHSAIVAREYGIPAVVSVALATELRDGMKLAVNGSNGEVLILK